METKGIGSKVSISQAGTHDFQAKEASSEGFESAQQDVKERIPIRSPTDKERQEIEKVAEELKGKMDSMGNNKVSFNVDKSSNDIVIKIIDRESNKTIRQIPSEEIVKLKEQIDNIKGILFNKFI